MADDQPVQNDGGKVDILKNHVQGNNEFGPWMLVQRPQRKRATAPKKVAVMNAAGDKVEAPNHKNLGGSHFNALNHIQEEEGDQMWS
ncbi:hypothetical protein SESBI_31000 [Sesbania bispinosa]|nr:hypothetical protein SESBI_31000 [Sesbania bispinosa]